MAACIREAMRAGDLGAPESSGGIPETGVSIVGETSHMVGCHDEREGMTLFASECQLEHHRLWRTRPG
jgi:hypothetical protein